MGEAQAARRLLGETEELIRAASEHPEDEPPWMYSYDDGWFDMQRGMAELALGDGRRAVRFLERGLAALPGAYRHFAAHRPSAERGAHPRRPERGATTWAHDMSGNVSEVPLDEAVREEDVPRDPISLLIPDAEPIGGCDGRPSISPTR
ncbi:hypothetical protein ABZW49_20780 [Nonomuraea wenchangensis]